jgi:hypothetical protein
MNFERYAKFLESNGFKTPMMQECAQFIRDQAKQLTELKILLIESNRKQLSQERLYYRFENLETENEQLKNNIKQLNERLDKLMEKK